MNLVNVLQVPNVDTAHSGQVRLIRVLAESRYVTTGDEKMIIVDTWG